MAVFYASIANGDRELARKLLQANTQKTTKQIGNTIRAAVQKLRKSKCRMGSAPIKRSLRVAAAVMSAHSPLALPATTSTAAGQIPPPADTASRLDQPQVN